jgi:hypothetical protein
MEKIKVIRLDRIDELLKEYNEDGYDHERFSEFIESTAEFDEENEEAKATCVWEEVEEDKLIKVKKE